MKNVVYIGGFGHWPDVADEFSLQKSVQTVGAAPAYEGEDISVLRNHPALPDDLPFAGSVSDLFKETDADIAVISTRLDCIAHAVIQAAEAGCNLICEKPLGVTQEEVKRIRDAVRANQVRLIPMLSMRTEPVFVKARELVRAGTIGEVALINTRKSYRFGIRPEWFGDRSKYGGTFAWVGIHAADMIDFITGLKFTSVSARQINFAHADYSDCEDCCTALFEMENKALATMSLDLLRPDAAPTHGDHWIRVVGTKGVLEASVTTGTVKLTNSDGEAEVEVPSFRPPLYLDILTDEQTQIPLAGVDAGFQLTKVMLCARDSADQDGITISISKA